ncbi:hypothetical protein DQW77_03495 [Roseovarius sp. TE539]|nr:hypothetical protein DQW77_03495 [Roseovarius sp. TE539]
MRGEAFGVERRRLWNSDEGLLFGLFRRLFLDGLLALRRDGELAFHGDHERSVPEVSFAQWIVPFRRSEWLGYAEPPSAVPRPYWPPERCEAGVSRST